MTRKITCSTEQFGVCDSSVTTVINELKFRLIKDTYFHQKYVVPIKRHEVEQMWNLCSFLSFIGLVCCATFSCYCLMCQEKKKLQFCRNDERKTFLAKCSQKSWSTEKWKLFKLTDDAVKNSPNYSLIQREILSV